jgi:hypothetical protein
MATQDTCCSIAAYYKIPSVNLPAFKKLGEAFVEKTRSEAKCLYYGFTFNGDQAHCREGYEDGDGLLTHLEHVSDLIQDSLKLGEITRLEIHGPETELAKMRGPLADFKPDYFTLECGFRR